MSATKSNLRFAIALTLASISMSALAQERPTGLKDPGQQPPNRPSQVPT
ncbi:MAG: hypothetical protein ACAH95_11715 [Fimbriimonas sp.]